VWRSLKTMRLYATKSHNEFYVKDNTTCHVIARANVADSKDAAEETGEVNVLDLACSLP
jgi:hypothetical protein